MKKQRAEIRIYQAAVFFFWFSQYTYVPNLSAYLRELGASLTLIGIVTGSYGFTQMLARIPLGILSDRIGRRKIFVSAGFLLSLTANILFLLFRRFCPSDHTAGLCMGQGGRTGGQNAVRTDDHVGKTLIMSRVIQLLAL